MIKDIDKGKAVSAQLIHRTLTDSFIIILNAAELLGIDLEASLKKASGIENHHTDLSKLTEIVWRSAASNYPWLKGNQNEMVIGLLLELADEGAVFAKASDSLDHMEGIDRGKIGEALIDLLTVFLVVARATKLDYLRSVPLRWREIEAGRVL
jgi:hypothetical protein